jgi:hypothetical protein
MVFVHEKERYKLIFNPSYVAEVGPHASTNRFNLFSGAPFRVRVHIHILRTVSATTIGKYGVRIRSGSTVVFDFAHMNNTVGYASSYIYEADIPAGVTLYVDTYDGSSGGSVLYSLHGQFYRRAY